MKLVNIKNYNPSCFVGFFSGIAFSIIGISILFSVFGYSGFPLQKNRSSLAPTKKQLYERIILDLAGEKFLHQVDSVVSSEDFGGADQMFFDLGDTCCQSEEKKGLYLILLGTYADVHRKDSSQANKYYLASKPYCKNGCVLRDHGDTIVGTIDLITISDNKDFQDQSLSIYTQLSEASKSVDVILPPTLDICLLLNENCLSADKIVKKFITDPESSYSTKSLKKLSEMIMNNITLSGEQENETEMFKYDDSASEEFSQFEAAYDSRTNQNHLNGNSEIPIIRNTKLSSKERLKQEIIRLKKDVSSERYRYETTHSAIERLFRVYANDLILSHSLYEITTTRYALPKFKGIAIYLKVNGQNANTTPTNETLKKAIACLNKTIDRYENRKSRKFNDYQSSIELIIPNSMWVSRNYILENIKFIDSDKIKLVESDQSSKLEINLRSDNFYDPELKEWNSLVLNLEREIRIRKMKLNKIKE